MSTLRVVTPPRLDELAQVIEDEHGRVVRAGQEMIRHAIAAGEALLEARDIVPHGEWLEWMERSLTVCVWTAHRYMRLATHKDALITADVRYIEDGMRLLADKPRLAQGPRALSEKDRGEIFGHYHEHGMGATMKAWGVAKSTVWRIVSKKSPARYEPDEAKLPPEVTEEATERLAQWLVERFGGDDYPVRVTDEVRRDAEAALTAAHTPPDESGLSQEEKLKRAREMYEAGQTYAQIAARLGVATNTVLRWMDADRAETSRAGSRAWKDENRERNRERDRLHAADSAPAPIRSVSPFDRLMWERDDVSSSPSDASSRTDA